MPKEGPRECGLSIGRRGDISRPLILIPAHSLLPFCKCQNRTALPLCTVALGRAATSFSSSHSLPLQHRERWGIWGGSQVLPSALSACRTAHTAFLDHIHLRIATGASLPPLLASPSLPHRSFPKIPPAYAMPSLPTPQDVQGVRPNPSMATLLSTGQRRCFDALPLANFSGTNKGSQRPRTSLLHTQ